MKYTVLRYFTILSCCYSLQFLLGCGPSAEMETLINLPADGPILIVGEADAGPLEQMRQALGKESLTAPYRMLEEDSLFNYRNLVLLTINHDSLTAHRRTSVERFAAAGGRVLIRDERETIPYEWDWYNGIVDGQKRPSGVQLLSNGGVPDTAFFATVADMAPASAATLPLAAPKEDRFQMEILDDNIYEPMEMEILPNGNVLFLERRGKMKLNVKGKTQLVHDFDVCIEGNYEDGLHGIALDPGYGTENDWIYLYYTPAPCDSLDQLLSRFEFKNGVLDVASESVVLRVTVQRDKCCHSGGGLEFGPDGLLYLSTGDNTSSKESDGYTPIDERPGRGPFDAQKSSGNTADLRGKILRIKPTDDGGYEIPEGNLFPNGEGGRPEIYVMGARNPFRIAIDPWNSYLYWGDVGPDVGAAGRYGPESFDEWNQARAAGNFGWPYFVGDNYAYPDRDFATDEVGPLFDPDRPVNESPNNFGAKVLPPAQPAFIWYPYGPSKEFPQLGEGSRSAMAGPFYNMDNLVPITNSALPEYYHGKWFIYEWARSWIKVVTLDSNRQEIVQIEDFLPETTISKPIDFKIARDGSIYLLEYGNDYFLNNPDARLIRLSYSARNRPPVARLKVDETAGGIPFSPRLSAEGSSDPDPRDSLSYRWYLDGELQAETVTFSPLITSSGAHAVKVEVRDETGSISEASISLVAGNQRPDLSLTLTGNQSFLLDGRTSFSYVAAVEDREDRSSGRLKPEEVVVNAAWLDDPTLIAGLRRGEARLPAGDIRYAAGAGLIAESDCYTCHKERAENIGPAYLAVAERYDDSEATIKQLAQKVIKGGNGVWGERLMSAHPTLSPEAAETMVGYILSLNNGGRLPLKGIVRPGAGEGAYVLAASYRDGGGRNAPPLVGQQAVVLRPTRMEVEHEHDGLYRAALPGSGAYQGFSKIAFRPGGWLRLANIDLDGVSRFVVRLQAKEIGDVELRYGAPDGELLAKAQAAKTTNWSDFDRVNLTLPTSAGALAPGDIYLVWKGEGGVVEDDMGHHRPGDLGWVDAIEVEGVAR